MRKPIVIGGQMVAAQVLGIPGALAGPWEDGMAAYNRDYVPAIRLFRPLAEKGNPKAQSVLGVMYRRGQGSPAIRPTPSSGSAVPRRAATPRRSRNCATSRRP